MSKKLVSQEIWGKQGLVQKKRSTCHVLLALRGSSKCAAGAKIVISNPLSYLALTGMKDVTCGNMHEIAD